jgi:hypothetical protein
LSNSIVVPSPARLALRLRYDGRCLLDEVRVGGRNVMANRSGAWTGVKVDGQWHTTLQNLATPTVTTTKDTATIRDLHFTGGGVQFKETWQFTAKTDRILWRIEREYLTGGLIEEVALAGWDFADMSTWTGALLGHGGVAWCKLFDQTNATYGVHAGPVTLWNRNESACLRIIPSQPDRGTHRHPVQPPTRRGLHARPRAERRSAGPAARPATVSARPTGCLGAADGAPGLVAIEFTLQALNYEQAYDRGQFARVNGASIREILNTIARIGAIDDEIMGSNGYYSGFAVLHEPWIAQLGLAIDDPAYFQAYARTLNHQRDHAIGPDGRVKSRWSYTAGDAMPGTYDAHGYYECQWGWLMDSQPSYAINVAELFDFTGDLDWLRSHQASVRMALDFLLRRDADGDGLVEMATDSHRDAKGSDWIDVIWAAHENAFVNAQLYLALTLWADAEEILGDHDRARSYRQRAALLKARFNAPTTAGGFWSEAKNCFIHWRDQDDSIHGDNLVVPVNFMAIAYDLCEPASRARGILDQIETRMRQEGLFFWPLCFDSYQTGEGADWQFPFPVYENGDIFLAWGETGTRAYAAHNPEVAVKYIREHPRPIRARRPCLPALPPQNPDRRGRRHPRQQLFDHRRALPKHLRHPAEMEPPLPRTPSHPRTQRHSAQILAARSILRNRAPREQLPGHRRTASRCEAPPRSPSPSTATPPAISSFFSRPSTIPEEQWRYGYRSTALMPNPSSSTPCPRRTDHISTMLMQCISDDSLPGGNRHWRPETAKALISNDEELY